MTDLTPQQVASADCAYWATYNRIVLANGQIFNFQDRPYQVEPMRSEAPQKCYMKATGGGFSEAEILDSIHGMRYGRYPQGVGYYFPTDTDMQDYVKSRFNPLIVSNYDSIGRFLRSAGGKGSDSASFKRIGNSNLFLRGGRLNPGDEGTGAKKSTKATGIQFDKGVLDEVDQMDPELIAKVRGRMKNAAIDGIKGKSRLVFIANPSDEDFGIDLIWQLSDQRHWFRKCESCGEWTCPELEFPECIKEFTERQANNHRGYVCCKKCGNQLPIRPGQWVAAKSEIKDFEGWRWSHLSSVYCDPYAVLQDFINPPEGNLGDVYRLQLGLPYSSQEDKLKMHDVLACCGSELMPTEHTGPCAMGVDVGKTFHIVIGIKTGRDRYEILKVAQRQGFPEIHDLAAAFHVRSSVIDIRPYEDSARQFQKSERHKIYLCEYTDSPLQDADFNTNTGVVKVYRTGIFDASHRIITKGQISIPRQCPQIEEFARQCCNCVKSKVEDKRRHQIIYRYKPTGTQEDHYRNALNYFLLAARRLPIIQSRGTRNLQEYATHETVKI